MLGSGCWEERGREGRRRGESCEGEIGKREKRGMQRKLEEGGRRQEGEKEREKRREWERKESKASTRELLKQAKSHIHSTSHSADSKTYTLHT